MTILISVDIDGTLEVGDPPGGVTMEMVRWVQGMGCLGGSCSDRTVSEQRRIWRDHGLKVEFTVLKHRLDEVKERYSVDEYYHVGDTEADAKNGKISISSPIARALIGKSAGDSAEVMAPGGARSYEILKVQFV